MSAAWVVGSSWLAPWVPVWLVWRRFGLAFVVWPCGRRSLVRSSRVLRVVGPSGLAAWGQALASLASRRF
jgi:hypothetical protein